ncbi:galactose oxidase [Daedaleopsis nitida]|nr:galactose oxidase [Daedaleopsis nitida]
MPQAHWFSLSKTPFLARSSHCIAVTESGIILVYGGELKPREPIDSGTRQDGTPIGSLHVFDLAKSLLSQGWRMLTPDTKLLAEDADAGKAIPVPRVGATTLWHGDALYLWGGRGGVDMAPLDAYQAGVWKATVHSAQGPLQSVRWERISAENEDEAPEPRSYHTAVAHGGHIYVHAGCPESGRLSTLHTFSLQDKQWKTLASAPEPARGGTVLVAAALAEETSVLLRYGGFCGHELPAAGEVDIYVVSQDKWVTVQPTADPAHGSPGPRSVHGFTPFQSPLPELANAVAVVYHGERDASNAGHAAAGSFWDDVWLLSKEPGGDILAGWAWQRLDVVSEDDDHFPEGRGWFPPVSWVDPHGESKVVMFGGLLSDNSRSDELWELEIN